MKKFIKYTLLGITSIAALGAIMVPVVNQINTNNSKNNLQDINNNQVGKYSIIDNNGNVRKYNSYDEILNDMLKSTDVDFETFVGKIGKPNSITGEVSGVENLKKFDSSKKERVFIGKDGKEFNSQSNAANSFLQETKNKYQDNMGNLFSTKQDAINSNMEIKKSETIGVYYYRIYDKKMNQFININPLNKKDIDMFKKIALRNIGITNSNFSASYGADLDNTTHTNSDLLFALSNNHNGDVKKSALLTVNKIMSLLSNEKNKVSYNIELSINPNSNYALLSSKKYRSLIDIGSGGNSVLVYQPVDTNKGSKYYKEVKDAKYYFYENGKQINNPTINNLSSTEFNDTSLIFTKKDFLVRNSEKFDDVVTIDLNQDINSDFPGGYFKYSLPNNYRVTVPATKQVIEIRTNGQKDLTGDANRRYSFADINDRVLSQSSGEDDVNFRLGVSVNDDAIIDKKNMDEIINKISEIIINDFIYSSKEIKDAFLNAGKVSEITNIVKKSASDIFNGFINALNSSKTIGKNDDPTSVTKDVTYMFSDKNNASDVENSLNSTKSVWWINKLLTQNTFYNAFDEILNNLSIYKKNISNEFLYINYNNVPVFKVVKPSISDQNIKTLDEEVDALKALIEKNEENLKNIINISSNIEYSNYTSGYILDKTKPDKINWEQNEGWSKLGSYILDGTFNDEQLNKAQNLLPSDTDSIELLRNDTGVNASINLYNKYANRINKINNELAQNYVAKIDENNVGSNEVLRLYEQNIDNKEFISNPLHVYYGEIMAIKGTFNPSLYDKVVYHNVKQKENISTSSIIPVEVPVIWWNDKYVPLINIANESFESELIGGISGAETSNLEKNAYAVLLKYVKEDTTRFSYEGKFYDEGTDINSFYTYYIGSSPFSRYFAKEKYYFIDQESAKKQFKNVLAKNAIADYNTIK